MNEAGDKWDAKDYAVNSSAQELWANELIDKLEIQGGEHVLDIGCGDGKVTASIAKKIAKKDTGGTVVGIDRSRDMIALAQAQFNLPNLSFYRMDATAISLEGKFDVAFSNAALHWVQDHKAVLGCLRSCLNKKAKILFQMGGHGNAEDLLEIVQQVTGSGKWERYFKDFVFPYRFCTIDDYEKWLPETGYAAKCIELISKDMVHESIEGLKGWLRTTWFPYTNQLPDTMKEDFLNTVVEQYITAYPVDSQGRTHVKMVRLEVEANVSDYGKQSSINKK